MVSASCRALILGLSVLTGLGAADTQEATPREVWMREWPLLPAPRHWEMQGTVPIGRLLLDGIDQTGLPSALQRALEEARASFPSTAGTAPDLLLDLQINGGDLTQAQGYTLSIGPAGMLRVVAHDEAGAFYAAQTLKQLGGLARERGALPQGTIRDWPDFANRGVMLDIARDKVPEMSTLFELVDLLASWKYNQFQLYTEHTFAYRGHHVVWQDASPMTPAQVRELDAYSRDRFMELVPNQNSFAHMSRWLSLPEYSHLAEIEGGTMLSPADPGSIELLRGMYAFMLPHFSSAQFNVGCDETAHIGKGRSKDVVEARGVGRVYLEFLLKIHALVTENGKQMQFWGDIINNHPELIPELPKDMIAMEWGYEADHPFAEHAQRFHENGIRFYVVPGTSSWNSLLGRTDVALANLRNAAENGIRFGGEGFLITDWGDGGHWQFLPVSLLPYAYGAAVSWCYAQNQDLDIASATSRYAFQDPAGIMGQVAYDLGNAHQRTGGRHANNTTYSMLMQRHMERPFTEAGLDHLRGEDLQATIAFIDEVLARLPQARMERPDAEIILAEFRMNAALAQWACRLGIARVEAGGVATSQLPSDVRAHLAAGLAALLDDYRQLWLARNRSGGLKESVGRLEGLLALLRQG